MLSFANRLVEWKQSRCYNTQQYNLYNVDIKEAPLLDVEVSVSMVMSQASKTMSPEELNINKKTKKTS